MKITPKKGILLIKKHKSTALKADITVEETDNDKSLLTGEILVSNEADYKKGETIIFGKYSLFGLKLQSKDYYFIDVEDIIGTCEYTEK